MHAEGFVAVIARPEFLSTKSYSAREQDGVQENAPPSLICPLETQPHL